MKRRGPAQTSRPLNPADYPHLSEFLRGYLNQDVLLEYGSPTAAATAFRRDADASQLRALQDELKRFENAVQTMSLEEMNALLSQLGSSWIFQSRDEFRSLSRTLLKKSPQQLPGGFGL
ncbi:MAG TPA: contact-dependent growth inhibition system immunity protein [Terriglobales bacterium]|nr:contact-dependent growth inhibition system immunity protein [Terriglobales bacterium]